jgi:hypothetical protein
MAVSEMSQHLVGHFKNASKKSEEIFMAEITFY